MFLSTFVFINLMKIMYQCKRHAHQSPTHSQVCILMVEGWQGQILLCRYNDTSNQLYPNTSPRTLHYSRTTDNSELEENRRDCRKSTVIKKQRLSKIYQPSQCSPSVGLTIVSFMVLSGQRQTLWPPGVGTQK